MQNTGKRNSMYVDKTNKNKQKRHDATGESTGVHRHTRKQKQAELEDTETQVTRQANIKTNANKTNGG